MFDLSKPMKNHSITFPAQQLAQSYVDFFDKDSSDALLMETNRENDPIPNS
jgi:hypothetical protein